MLFNDIVRCFEAASYPVSTVAGDSGCFAVTPAAARVIAVAPAEDEESFLFTPAGIRNTAAFAKDLYGTAGAPGGDRLWFAPEYAYFWQSEPKDVVAFSNYSIPAGADPGHYGMKLCGDNVVVEGDIVLCDHRCGNIVSLFAKRRISPSRPDVDLEGIRYAGYRIDQQLSVRSGIADLWSVAQVPPASIIVVPLIGKAPPTPYFNRADTRLTDSAFVLYGTGGANAKVGYGCRQVTGRAAAFSRVGAQLSMVLKMFTVETGMHYCDGLSPDHPGDQVFQAWDGFGFCELEHHSAAAGTVLPSSVVEDCSYLYGFRGHRDRIIALAETMLAIPKQEIREIL